MSYIVGFKVRKRVYVSPKAYSSKASAVKVATGTFARRKSFVAKIVKK
jgi:hypothetical protein